MTTVRLSYGRAGLEVQVPDHAQIVAPRDVAAVADERTAITGALCAPISGPPLRDRVRPGDTVVIVHSDLTRPMPNDRVLPVLLAELESAGVRRDDITLLCALGTHRRQTDAELAQMLGREIIDGYRCAQHDAERDDDLVPLGQTLGGHPVRVNRAYLAADVRILTGFIEPHFFAGFSGGPKAVMPGVAGAESVRTNHGADMIAHPRATWGVTHGNPIWEEMLDVAERTDPAFLLNVTLNRDRRITGVFAGDMGPAHAAGCAFCRASAFVPVPHPFDVVVTTNSGFPLDLNLYQSVKGMSAAARITRPGGDIVIATECRDGLPEHGAYAALLREAESPEDLLARVEEPDFSAPDQWQVQIQARIQRQAEVHVYSEGLTDEQIRAAHLTPCRDIRATIDTLLDRHGPGATLCVLPEGPLTVPTVDDRQPARQV